MVMTSTMGSEVYRNGDPQKQQHQHGIKKEPIVACHDLWKSCWVQGDQYKKYQQVGTGLPKLETPFNPSNFQPASVFLKSSTLKTNDSSTVNYFPSDKIAKDKEDDCKSTISGSSSICRSKSEAPLSSIRPPLSASCDMDAFDKSYESALRRNASLSLGLTNQLHSMNGSSTRTASSNQRNRLVHGTQYRPPLRNNPLSKYDNDIKRMDYMKQHLLNPSTQTQHQKAISATSSYANPGVSFSSSISSTCSQVSPSITAVESNLCRAQTLVTSAVVTVPAGTNLSASSLQQESYPLQYGTLPHKKSNKPRPLQSRTLQRHKSSAEIYSKSSSTVQESSSLNRLMSISAEDIRRSLKGTNGALQKLLSYGKKKASVKSLTDTNCSDSKLSKDGDIICVTNGG